MNLNAFRILNVARCEAVFHPLDAWSASDWGVAMAGECGEVCDAIKKYNRIKFDTNKPDDPNTVEDCKTAIAMELADLIIYADLLAASLDINLSAAIKYKFNLVSAKRNCDIVL